MSDREGASAQGYWKRLCHVVGAYRERYRRWPSRLIVPRPALIEIESTLATERYHQLKTRIAIVPVDCETVLAYDEDCLIVDDTAPVKPNTVTEAERWLWLGRVIAAVSRRRVRFLRHLNACAPRLIPSRFLTINSTVIVCRR